MCNKQLAIADCKLSRSSNVPDNKVCAAQAHPVCTSYAVLKGAEAQLPVIG
jgi:hypothetical protein